MSNHLTDLIPNLKKPLKVLKRKIKTPPAPVTPPTPPTNSNLYHDTLAATNKLMAEMGTRLVEAVATEYDSILTSQDQTKWYPYHIKPLAHLDHVGVYRTQLLKSGAIGFSWWFGDGWSHQYPTVEQCRRNSDPKLQLYSVVIYGEQDKKWQGLYKCPPTATRPSTIQNGDTIWMEQDCWYPPESKPLDTRPGAYRTKWYVLDISARDPSQRGHHGFSWWTGTYWSTTYQSVADLMQSVEKGFVRRPGEQYKYWRGVSQHTAELTNE